jgi:hypothetical protein
MALPCRLSSEGRQRKILTTGTSVPPKTIKEKKEYEILHKKPRQQGVFVKNGPSL